MLPPDPNGDVGPNHYVQWVNTSFAIYDKSGTLLYGPAAGNTLWAGFGVAAGFIFKANGWAEKDPVTAKVTIYWSRFTADLTSAAMIYLLSLAVAAAWPALGYGEQPPAITAGTVVVLFLIGLRPLAENLQAFFLALIARVKGGAS